MSFFMMWTKGQSIVEGRNFSATMTTEISLHAKTCRCSGIWKPRSYCKKAPEKETGGME